MDLSEAMIPSFDLWNEFDSLELPSTSCAGFSCVISTIGEKKNLTEITYSHHITFPKVTSVKEIRTSKGKNEVQFALLGDEFGTPKMISSVEELNNVVTQFFSTKHCYGLPFDAQFNGIRKMEKGRKNCLNRWQSTECSGKIIAGYSCCLRCEKLEKALAVAETRRSIIQYNFCCNFHD